MTIKLNCQFRARHRVEKCDLIGNVQVLGLPDKRGFFGSIADHGQLRLLSFFRKQCQRFDEKIEPFIRNQTAQGD